MLEVAHVEGLDFTLEPSAVSESVEVSATATALENQSTSLGQVIQEKTINDLPLNGRNYLQ